MLYAGMLYRHRCYKKVHNNEVTETSKHHKNMENLMGTEVLMTCIENRNFQCIDNSADGVNDSSGEKPAKTGSRQRMKNRDKCQYAQPAHSDIQNGRNPFGTADPETFQNDSEDCNSPYKSAEDITGSIMQCNETNRSIASGNHNEDHHVIHFSESAVDFLCRVNGMIYGACCIKQDHSQYKNAQCNNVNRSGIAPAIASSIAIPWVIALPGSFNLNFM